MSRISRKNWTMEDFGNRNSKGLFGLIDVAMKETYRITDDEYDNLCDILSDDEMDVMASERPSFMEKRKMIEILNKYIQY